MMGWSVVSPTKSLTNRNVKELMAKPTVAFAFAPVLATAVVLLKLSARKS